MMCRKYSSEIENLSLHIINEASKDHSLDIFEQIQNVIQKHFWVVDPEQAFAVLLYGQKRPDYEYLSSGLKQRKRYESLIQNQAFLIMYHDVLERIKVHYQRNFYV